jgi:hypothetical protein
MKKFRAIDILSILANRGINHSSYDFERLIFFLTGSSCYDSQDLEKAQYHLCKQFPGISKIAEKDDKRP